MTINELKRVYQSKATVTELAYFQNGEYYSFRTVYDEPTILKEIDDDISSLKIRGIYPREYHIQIDVIRILDC